jgi:hypothetical protein
MHTAANKRPGALGPTILLVFTIAMLIGVSMRVSSSVGADGATPSLRSSTSASAARSDAITLGRPSGVTSADVLLAVVAVRSTESRTVQPPSGWRLVRADECRLHGDHLTQAIFVRTASGSEPGSYTFGLGGTSGAAGSVLGYSGADASSPVSAHSGDGRRKSEWLRAPSVSVGDANTRLVGAYAHNGASSFDTPGSMTNVVRAVTGEPAVTSAVADEAVATTGASSDRAVRLQGDQSSMCTVGQLVALRPGGGSGSVPPPPPPPPPPAPSPGGAPQPVQQPSVTGTATVGQTLTGNGGTWTNSPTGYSYAWRRCNTSGADCSTVGGATARTYVLSSADVGRAMRFVATATNAAGSTSASSAPTAAVRDGGTPPPPPPPPPPSSGNGTTITVTSRWVCDRPLSQYGTLPIRVVSTIQNATFSGNAAIALSNGCTGDGNPQSIDLVLNVNGNGTSIGTNQDAIRIAAGAHDIQFTGYAECGAPAAGAHQDMMQAGGGERITAYDFRTGSVATGSSTCRGALGGWATAGFGGSNQPIDVVCVRCAIATFNHGLFVGAPSTRSGARDSTFVGRLPITVTSNVSQAVNLNNVGINSSSASGPTQGPQQSPTPQSSPVPGPTSDTTIALAVVDSTETSVRIAWPSVPGATGYRLYMDGVSVSTAGPRATSARFGWLERRPYTLRVQVLGTAGNGTIDVVPSRNGWVERR